MVQMTRIGRCFSGACLILLTFCSAALGIQQPYGNQQVTLGWTASPDPSVVGYYLYYGTSSTGCTNKINVGTNTAFVIGGLVPGLTYYFTETSYNAASVESSYVPQISYSVPGLLAVSQNPTNGAMILQFLVAPGQAYELQASSDLNAWTSLWLTSVQTTNEWIEYDDPITNTVPAKFYRLKFNAQ